MGSYIGNPPLPTDQGPDPAPDVPAVNAYSPSADTTTRIEAAISNLPGIKQIVDYTADLPDNIAKTVAAIAKMLAPFMLAILKDMLGFEEGWLKGLSTLYEQELSTVVPIEAGITQIMLNLALEGLGEGSPNQTDWGNSPLAQPAESIFNDVIQRFTLLKNTADITQNGSGFQNVQYLLQQSLLLAILEYNLQNASNHLGMGWLKDLQPIIWLIDRCINPSNVVRQAVEQGYSYLMKAPLQRDLNHAWPIKNLGVSALCKLYIRGGIDENTYLEKCLDAGLNNQQAQQLILETAKLLSSSQLGELMNHQFITSDDAKQQLLEQGYPDWQADAIIYLETHSRYFSYQERVGGEAVTAWKQGKIDQSQLEALLPTLGFTQDEIALLEIEGQFTKSSTDQKSLTYSQIHSMFEANIVDLDYVINFLMAEGYAPDDVTRLVLLDFVKAEERALKQAELEARIRVQAESERASAAVEANKNETDLANARIALANQLDSIQQQLGLLQSLPSIMDLIGIALP